MLTVTPIAEQAGPSKKLWPSVRWLAPRVSASCARSKVPSIEALLHELVRAISSGRHFVAVGWLPRWIGRRSFDASMRERMDLRWAAPECSGPGSSPGRGIRYCRSGRLFWICAESPFTAPHGAIVRDAQCSRIQLGDYWIKTRREGERWLTRACIDPMLAMRLGINAIWSDRVPEGAPAWVAPVSGGERSPTSHSDGYRLKFPPQNAVKPAGWASNPQET